MPIKRRRTEVFTSSSGNADAVGRQTQPHKLIAFGEALAGEIIAVGRHGRDESGKLISIGVKAVKTRTPTEFAMPTHRFGRKLKLPSTRAIKHDILTLMLQDHLKVKTLDTISTEGFDAEARGVGDETERLRQSASTAVPSA